MADNCSKSSRKSSFQLRNFLFRHFLILALTKKPPFLISFCNGIFKIWKPKIRMINQPCYILHFEFVLPVPMYCKLNSAVSPTAVKIQLEFLQSIGPKFSVKLTDSLSQIVRTESN